MWYSVEYMNGFTYRKDKEIPLNKRVWLVFRDGHIDTGWREGDDCNFDGRYGAELKRIVGWREIPELDEWAAKGK